MLLMSSSRHLFIVNGCYFLPRRLTQNKNAQQRNQDTHLTRHPTYPSRSSTNAAVVKIDSFIDMQLTLHLLSIHKIQKGAGRTIRNKKFIVNFIILYFHVQKNIKRFRNTALARTGMPPQWCKTVADHVNCCPSDISSLCFAFVIFIHMARREFTMGSSPCFHVRLNIYSQVFA